MKAQDKISRIKRLIKKLANKNRDLESYRDDLYFCFYEIWSVKDWIINDLELLNIHPNLKPIVEAYVNSNKFLRISFDIANREKHLTLRNARIGGEITKSNIGVSITEHISVSAEVSVELIHVDDLLEHDNIQKLKDIEKEENQIKLPAQHSQIPTEISQDYTIQTSNGETYDAIDVLELSLKAWEDLIDSLIY